MAARLTLPPDLGVDPSPLRDAIDAELARGVPPDVIMRRVWQALGGEMDEAAGIVVCAVRSYLKDRGRIEASEGGGESTLQGP